MNLLFPKRHKKKIKEEQDLVNKIVVPLKRTNTHWLIKKTELSLHTSYRTKHFLNSSTEEGVFNLFVSSKELNRALRILDTVIKALEKRNYVVFIKGGLLYVKMFGVELSFSIKEQSKRILLKHDITYSYNQYDFISTGILILNIADFYCQHSIQRNFADVKSIKLEERLNEFIVGLIVASQAKIAQDLHWEKESKLQEELERKRQEAIEAIENKKRKLVELKRNVKKHHQSNLIREYISKYKLKLNDESLTSDQRNEIDEYIEWALKQADRLDPFIESPPSILDNLKNLEEDEW